MWRENSSLSPAYPPATIEILVRSCFTKVGIKRSQQTKEHVSSMESRPASMASSLITASNVTAFGLLCDLAGAILLGPNIVRQAYKAAQVRKRLQYEGHEPNDVLTSFFLNDEPVEPESLKSSKQQLREFEREWLLPGVGLVLLWIGFAIQFIATVFL